MARKLQLGTLSNSASSAVVDLVHVVTELKCADEWLALIDKEFGYIMALSRLISEKKKEARNAPTQTA